MKWFLTIITVLLFISGYTQSKVGIAPCRPGKLKPQIDQSDSLAAVTYKKTTLLFYTQIDSSQMQDFDSLFLNGIKLDRLNNAGIPDFEEALPFMDIADWKLLVRINQMVAPSKREDEYKQLARTYRALQPHLFGVFNEGYAVVKTEQGYNYVNQSGQLLFNCYFQNVTNFVNGFAHVKQNNNWYLIDPDGVFYKINKE